jgi:hypothetical protein
MYERLAPFNSDFVAYSNELLGDQLLQIATDMTGCVLYPSNPARSFNAIVSGNVHD